MRLKASICSMLTYFLYSHFIISFFWSPSKGKEHILNGLSREKHREGNGSPLQYSCLENPMDGGAWWAAVHGVAKSQMCLSDFIFTFLHWRRKWQPTPECSCLENPRDGGAWWAAIYGVAQSRTRLKQLSSSSSREKQPVGRRDTGLREV